MAVMRDSEVQLRAILDAVAKLQPLLADPSSHCSELTLLKEQVDRIAALAGDRHEGGTRVQLTCGSRLKGEDFEQGELAPGSRGVRPATSALRPGGSEYATKRDHGDHRNMALQRDSEAHCFSGEPPTATQSSRLPWDQVERIASLVGQHSISNPRMPWDHVERVSSMAVAQPPSSARGTMDVNAGDQKISVSPPSNKPTSKIQGGDEDCSEYGPPQDSLLSGRTYKTGKWAPAETLALVHLRRSHFVKQHLPHGRRNVKAASAAERWAEVEDEMFKRNVMRSKSQCQEKWEQLASDFRKVHDHQRNHVPLGEPGYFQMNSAERKERMLRFPKAQLDEAVYNALCEWYSKGSNVVTDLGDSPNDTVTSADVNAPTPSLAGNVTENFPIPASEAQVASEEEMLRPTAHEDGIGDSSSPNLTKRRRLSTKASEGAFSVIKNPPQGESLNTNLESLVNMNSLLVEQDREDARHRLTLELDAKKHCEMLELKARIHQDKIIIENERLQRGATLGQGYINAMLSIADALKHIGETLKKKD